MILGNVLQAGVGQNPARQAALKAGLPDTIAAFTVNKVCGSGLKSVALAAQAIKAGDGDIFVAGGMESMTNAPYLIRKARSGLRLGNGELTDAMVADGLWDVYEDFHMGNTAELVADEYDVTRQAPGRVRRGQPRQGGGGAGGGQVRRGDRSRRGAAAQEGPDRLQGGRGRAARLRRGGPRQDAPGVQEGRFGHGGQRQPDLGRRGRGRRDVGKRKRTSSASSRSRASPATRPAGVEPKWVMMAPVKAGRENSTSSAGRPSTTTTSSSSTRRSARRRVPSRVSSSSIPSASTSTAALWRWATRSAARGCRILVTLLYAMADRNAKTGLATLCLGGGNAVALSVEAV